MQYQRKNWIYLIFGWVTIVSSHFNFLLVRRLRVGTRLWALEKYKRNAQKYNLGPWDLNSKNYLNMHNSISMFKKIFKTCTLGGGGGGHSPLWPLSGSAIDGCKIYIFVCLYVCVSSLWEMCYVLVTVIHFVLLINSCNMLLRRVKIRRSF